MLKKYLLLAFYAAFSFGLNDFVMPWMKDTIDTAASHFQRKVSLREVQNVYESIMAYDVCLIEIKNNKASIKECKDYCVPTGRVYIFLTFLNDMLKNSKVEDLQFILGVGDASFKLDVPLFAMDKSIDNNNTFLVPDTASIDVATGADIAYLDSVPFESKINKMIWRGVSTCGFWLSSINDLEKGCYRYNLVKHSLGRPDLIDARFNRCVQASPEVCSFLETQGCISPTMGLVEQAKYKYQIIVDGNVSAWGRLYWQPFTGSLIFKQDSTFQSWVSAGLVPYVHYIPVKRDLSDLINTMESIKESDAKRISSNALSFAKNNLTYKHLQAHMYYSLVKYSKILRR